MELLNKSNDKIKFSHKSFDKNLTIYVLALENGFFYVGKTYNLARRLEEHKEMKGSLWTKKHKFIELYETIENCLCFKFLFEY